MARHIGDGLLRQLRNDIPIEMLISHELKIPYKHSERYFRFLCPRCNEFNTATKKETNLARCFRCKINFNPIDMVMDYCGLNFLDTVKFLKPILSVLHKNTNK